jgi:hypothetical protein
MWNARRLLQMSETTMAYIAGIIDGEGGIYMTRNSCGSNANPERDGPSRPCGYKVLVSVVTTSKPLAEFLPTSTGAGRVRFEPGIKRRRLDSWQWRLHTHWAVELLETIRPYLLIKRLQADLVINFAAAKRSNGDPGQMLAERCFRALRESNQRGQHARLYKAQIMPSTGGPT